MLEIDTAIEKIKAALKKTVRTWRAYVPTNIPIAVYNDEEYVFINHPDPPDVRPDNMMAATS